MSRRLACWRMYAYQDGTLTARPLSPSPDHSIVGDDRSGAYYVRRPLLLHPSAVALLTYRDDPHAIRSPRWNAAAAWCIRTYGL